MKILKDINKIIKKSEKIVLFHHVNPDGDSLSSSYGLMKALQLKYPNKEIKWIADKEYLQSAFGYMLENFDDAIETIDETWTAIVGDVAIKDRIYKYDEFYKAGKKIVFDHHTNEKDIECDVYWQDSSLGASSVQAYWIVKNNKIKLTSKVALSILFGILTDTGNFIYSLNDKRPIDAASELMSFIERPHIDQMHKDFRKRTLQDVNFQGYALSNFISNKGLAYLKIKDKDLTKLKLTSSQARRVNLIGNIEGISVWMFLVEDKENDSIKISLRSNGFPVNEIASKFDGGGHVRASGIKIKNDWKKADEVIDWTIKQINKK